MFSRLFAAWIWSLYETFESKGEFALLVRRGCFSVIRRRFSVEFWVFMVGDDVNL